MAKLKLGGIEFETEFYNGPFGFSSYGDIYLSETLERIHKRHKRMMWNCNGNIRMPAPYPTQFSGIEPHILIYDVPKGQSVLSRASIDWQSELAGRAFLRNTGYPDGLALNADLMAKLGKYQVSFNVDKAIAALKPKYRMDIRVRLKFMHLRLRHPKVIPDALISVSVPDKVVYQVKETHECTSEGLVKIKKKYKWYHTILTEPVKAETKTAYNLRREIHDQAIKRKEASQEQIEAEINEIKEDLKKMAPD